MGSRLSLTAMSEKEFFYQDPFPLGADETEYECIHEGLVQSLDFQGEKVLNVDPEALSFLAAEAIKAINFKLRSSHLEQVSVNSG